jgi:hypothetical protein
MAGTGHQLVILGGGQHPAGLVYQIVLLDQVLTKRCP